MQPTLEGTAPREEEQSDDDVDIETTDDKVDAVAPSAWNMKQEKVSFCYCLFLKLLKNEATQSIKRGILVISIMSIGGCY